MIWVRRFFAVLLVLLFLPLFFLALLLLHINATVLSANFYIQELRKADIPAFLYDKLLPTAFDESVARSWDLPVDSTKVRAKAIGALQEVFPPQWLQDRMESAVNQVAPYVTGETEGFTIVVPVKDRLVALGEVLKRETSDSDTYDLAFEGVVAPALRDGIKGMGDLPFGIVLPPDDVVAAVREVVSPQWLADRVAHVVDQLVPYFTGEADHFAIQVPVADRIRALAPVFKELLVRAQVYQVLSHPETAKSLDKFLAGLGPLPLDLKLTSADLLPVFQAAAPPEFLQQQVEQALDAAVPYVTGDRDSFKVVIPLKEPLQRAVPSFKDLLRKLGAYNVLVNQVLHTLVAAAVPRPIQVVGGVTITSEDVGATLKGALSPQFVEQQGGSVIDAMVPYLTGDAPSFRVVIPLAGQKAAVSSALEDLAVERLWQAIAPLRACTVQEAVNLALQGSLKGIPACRPVGYSLSQIQAALGIGGPSLTQRQLEAVLGVDLTVAVQGVTRDNLKGLLGTTLTSPVRQVMSAIPDQWAFTDADLGALGGPEQQQFLDKFREQLSKGFVYTDADLRKTLAGLGGGSGADVLDEALKWGREGFTYTDADLRLDLAGLGGAASSTVDLDDVLKVTRQGFTFTDADLRQQLDPDGTSRKVNTLQDVQRVLGSGEAQGTEALDAARWVLARFHSFVWLAYVVLALLLAAIGFLGGRRWRSRLAWAAVALALASGVVYVVAGPVYQGVARPALEARLSEQIQVDRVSKVSQLATEKGVAVAEMVINDLVTGLAWRALLFFAIAMVALGVALLGPRLLRRAGRAPPPEPAGG